MKRDASPGFVHSNSRWVSLLWDGLRFDRSDWVDEALSRGISPKIKDSAGVPAIHVAAYLNRSRSVDLLAQSGAIYPVYSEPYSMLNYAEFSTEKIQEYGTTPLRCAILHNNLPVFRTLMKMDGASDRSIEAWDSISDLIHVTGRGDIFAEMAMTEAVKQLGWEHKPAGELSSLSDGLNKLALCLTGYEFAPTFHDFDTKMPQRGNVRDPDHPAIKRIHIRFDEGAFSTGLPDGHEYVPVDLQTESDASSYIMRARISETALIEGDAWYSYNDGDVRSAASMTVFYCEEKAAMDRFVATRASVDNVAAYLAAVSRNDIDVVKECLKQGVDPDLSMWTRYTAADHALGCGYAQVLDAVLQSSDDLREYLKTLRVYNQSMQTPVGFAITRSRDYEEFDDMAVYLIRNGYESDTPDADGVTPLQHAMTQDRQTPVNAIQALLAAGVDTSFLEDGSPNRIPDAKLNPRAVQAVNAWRARNAIERAMAHAKHARSKDV